MSQDKAADSKVPFTHSQGAMEFLLLGAIWGSSFLFTRVASNDLGPLAVAFWRVSIAAAFLMPVMFLRVGLTEFKKQWLKLFWIGIFNNAIPFALYAYAVMQISTGMASILNATAPLFGAIVAWGWLGDKMNRWQVFGLILGILGVIMLTSGKVYFSPDGSTLAVLACLGATTCYAYSAAYTKRYLMGISPYVTAAGSTLGASLFLLPLALVFGYLFDHVPSKETIGSLLFVGLVCTGLAYILFFRIIERVGPAKTITVTYLIPVFGVLYGHIFLNEALSPVMIMGGLVVLLGTSMVNNVVGTMFKLPPKP